MYIPEDNWFGSQARIIELRASVVFPNPSRFIQGQCSYQAIAASFQILFNSLPISCFTVRRYELAMWTVMYSFLRPQKVQCFQIWVHVDCAKDICNVCQHMQ